MIRTLLVDEDAADEAEAQVRYYVERAGTRVALRFVAEIEAIYLGLVEGRFVGANYVRVSFRLPIKRIFLDRFPFAVVFYVDEETCMCLRLKLFVSNQATGARGYGAGESVDLDQGVALTSMWNRLPLVSVS